MRYLSGAVHAPIMRWDRGGLMLTQHIGNALNNLDGIVWAADNGCYTSTEPFTDTKWLRFLDRYAGKGECRFAVLPDVPFDMAATLHRSLPYLDVVHDLGYPVALAIQNGVMLPDIPWEGIEAVFIAGDVPFKTSLTAWRVCREAKKRGIYVHIARRNSKSALQMSYDMGADSIDGTFLRFAPRENWVRLQRWFEDFCPHNPQDLRLWGTKTHYSRCMRCGRDIWAITPSGWLPRRAA